MFFKRYSKEIIEPFALNTIGLSFDSKYLLYKAPLNSDNFDFISPDGKKALEITLVITENERNAYQYEIEKAKGKNKLDLSRVNYLKISDEHLDLYYGGSMSEIKSAIFEAIKNKQIKAETRIERTGVETIDLCICMYDGSLLDLNSFKLFNLDINNVIFDNIFFITPSYFIRYDIKNNELSEYPRIIN